MRTRTALCYCLVVTPVMSLSFWRSRGTPHLGHISQAVDLSHPSTAARGTNDVVQRLTESAKHLAPVGKVLLATAAAGGAIGGVMRGRHVLASVLPDFIRGQGDDATTSSENPFARLFGATLLQKEFSGQTRSISTEQVFPCSGEDEKEGIVAVYIDGKGLEDVLVGQGYPIFRPKLAALQEECRSEDKSFQVLYVSLDKTAKAAADHFTSMPADWLATQHSPALVRRLFSRLQIRSIPALYLFDRRGRLYNAKGYNSILANPFPGDYPWSPPAIKELLGSSLLQLSAANTPSNAIGVPLATSSALSSGKKAEVLALYFTASWCGPCQKFTPKLIEFQQKYSDKMTVVVVPHDTEEAAFNEYVKTTKMPFLSVPHNETKVRLQLQDAFEVAGIPTLVLLDHQKVQAGTTSLKDAIITKQGAARVLGDPEGARFPWRPSLVGDLSDPAASPEGLLEAPAAIVVFMEDATRSKKSEALQEVWEFAKDQQAKLEQNGATEDISPDIPVFVVTRVSQWGLALRHFAYMPPPTTAAMQVPQRRTTVWSRAALRMKGYAVDGINEGMSGSDAKITLVGFNLKGDRCFLPPAPSKTSTTLRDRLHEFVGAITNDKARYLPLAPKEALQS